MFIVERLCFFQGRTFFPGLLHLCMKHGYELTRDLAHAEALREVQP